MLVEITMSKQLVAQQTDQTDSRSQFASLCKRYSQQVGGSSEQSRRESRLPQELESLITCSTLAMQRQQNHHLQETTDRKACSESDQAASYPQTRIGFGSE